MFPFDADCADCRYLRLFDEKDGKFFCEKKKSYVSARARICNMAGETMGRCTPDKNVARDTSRRKGYFIVTMISKILDLGEKNIYLTTFQFLKDVVITSDPKYKSFLDIYEMDGPRLAEALENDEEAVEYATYLKESFLDHFVTTLQSGDIDKSLTIYTCMMIEMKKRYNMIKINDEKKLSLEPKESN